MKLILKRWFGISFLLTGLVLSVGCSTEETILANIDVTAVVGTTSSNQIEQVYYLGVFDSREQIDPII